MSTKHNYLISQARKSWMRPKIEVLNIKKDTFGGTGTNAELKSSSSKKRPN